MLPPGRLVAVTRWADDARHVERGRPSARLGRSGCRGPTSSASSRLRPDLVVVSEYTDADFLRLLEKSGLRHHRCAGSRALPGVRAAILDLGRAVGTPEQRARLAARFDAVLAELARRLARRRPGRASSTGRTRTPPARARRSARWWRQPGRRTSARELGLPGIVPLAGEKAFAADPDAFLVTQGSGAAVALRRHPLLSRTRAVREGRVVEMPNQLLVALSDRAADAALVARFPPPPRAGARGGSPAGPPVTERGRRAVVFAGLASPCPLAVARRARLGSVPLPLGGRRCGRGWRALGVGGPSPLAEMGEVILWSVRFPRVLIAALVGGGLAVVGAALQSLFRNPLADAGLLGVGPGAALGAVLAVDLGWAQHRFLAMPLAACAGALLALLLIYAIAHAGGRPTLSGLLLTGLAVSALAAAGTSVLLVAIEEFRVRTVLFWLAGGLEGRGYEHLALAAALRAARRRSPSCCSRGPRRALPRRGGGGGPQPAGPRRAHPRLRPRAPSWRARSRRWPAPCRSSGLVAPHALRALVGPLGRHLLPASFLAGAVLVVVADLAARSLGQYVELPLGSVTAFVGAPYFLLALRGQEGRG